MPLLLLPFQTAWEELDEGRPWSVGMTGAIPSGLQVTEIVRYADVIMDLEDFPEERRVAVQLILAQEREFMTHWAGEMTKKAAAKAK